MNKDPLRSGSALMRMGVIGLCLALAALFAALGEWQMGRHVERAQRNAQIAAERLADPVPVLEVMSAQQQPATDAEWTHIEATGSYLPQATVLILHRTFAGQSGLEVVVPFALETGQVLAVDRGWMPSPGADPVSVVPDPAPGKVPITGWVRRDGTGPSTVVHDQLARAISGPAIASASGLAVALQGFVMLDAESPQAKTPLTPPQLPEPSAGPHRYYAWQWRFFAALALLAGLFVGYGERRRTSKG